MRFSGNCWYAEYVFPIVEAQGAAHEVSCEWDVNIVQHGCSTEHEQASYYWVRKNDLIVLANCRA
jgi:hypothetical protein